MLYDSLHNKVLKLADDVIVYPGHGAGSLCGKNMRAERSRPFARSGSPIYAVKIDSREDLFRH